MTYAPPAYAPTLGVANPTAVMGRRIGAFFIDVVLPLVAAAAIGALIWAGSAYRIPRTEPGVTCDQLRAGQLSLPMVPGSTCVETNDSLYVASKDDVNTAAGVAFLVALLVPLNIILLQGFTGAALGKMLFGLRVVRSDGQVANFGWILLRSVLLLAAIVLSVFCGIALLVELIVASATTNHQRIGDMAAGTYVVANASVGTPIGAGPPPTYPSAQSPATGSPTMQPGMYGTSQPPFASELPVTPPPGAWGTVPPTEPALPPVQAVVPPVQAVVPPVQATAPPQPQWDAARNAWITWDPQRRAWLQWNDATKSWGPIS